MESPVPVVRFDSVEMLMDALRPVAALARPSIYPGYIALQIRKVLEAAAGKPVGDYVVEPGSVRSETVGDCRHAVFCKDFAGAEYRIDIECTRHADGWVPSRLRPGNTPAERIRKLTLALSLIHEAADGLAALKPEQGDTARLIARVAKEAVEAAE